jgi:hypothetical protein
MILAASGANVGALQQASRTVPIAFAGAIDPVGTELGIPGRTGSISKDSRSGHTWRDLLEQLPQFPAQTIFVQQKAGGIAAWPGQAIYEAAALSRSTWSGCATDRLRQSLTSA